MLPNFQWGKLIINLCIYDVKTPGGRARVAGSSVTWCELERGGEADHANVFIHDLRELLAVHKNCKLNKIQLAKVN